MKIEIRPYKNDNIRLHDAFFQALLFAGVLWAVKGVEVLLNLNFVQYGVYPLKVDGLVGILFAPLIHGSLSHLFSNTLPIVILGTALLYGYPRASKIVLPVIYFGSGLGVWLFARESYHIGASGLTFGMMFFVFMIGALRWDQRAIVISMIVFFLYGSMILGVFPGDPGVSFETHLFGAMIGISLAFFLKHMDPLPPQKTYSWEEESDDDWEEDE